MGCGHMHEGQNSLWGKYGPQVKCRMGECECNSNASFIQSSVAWDS